MLNRAVPMSYIPIAIHFSCATSSYIHLFTIDLVSLAREISLSEFTSNLFLLGSLNYFYTACSCSYCLQLETLSLAFELDLSQKTKQWYFIHWLLIVFIIFSPTVFIFYLYFLVHFSVHLGFSTVSF